MTSLLASSSTRGTFELGAKVSSELDSDDTAVAEACEVAVSARAGSLLEIPSTGDCVVIRLSISVGLLVNSELEEAYSVGVDPGNKSLIDGVWVVNKLNSSGVIEVILPIAEPSGSSGSTSFKESSLYTKG